jgi:hypothetical protein
MVEMRLQVVQLDIEESIGFVVSGAMNKDIVNTEPALVA